MPKVLIKMVLHVLENREKLIEKSEKTAYVSLVLSLTTGINKLPLRIYLPIVFQREIGVHKHYRLESLKGKLVNK